MQAPSPSAVVADPTPPPIDNEASTDVWAEQRARRQTALVWVLRLASFAVILLAWQLSADHRIVDPLYSGKPTAIAADLYHGLGDQYLSLARATLYEALVGFVLGVVVGLAIGIVLGRSSFLRRVFDPLVVALNSAPRIALAPLFVVWFGLGPNSRIAISFSLVVFIVLVNTIAGIQAAQREHLLLARVLCFGRWSTFRTFVLPAALPAIFAGLKLGIVYSFLAVVVGEMLIGTGGLGGQMAQQMNLFNTNEFFAMLILLIAITIAISALLSAIETRVLRWRQAELQGL
jgi:NitT/TauT family transport system permease protein